MLWLLVGFLTSQQHESVSQGRICSRQNCACRHTERDVADQTCYLTQSQYTETRQTSPSARASIKPGAWQGGHWSTNYQVTDMTRPRKNPNNNNNNKNPRGKRGWNPVAGIIEADDRQVTTVFTVQPSFHHRHSTNRVSRNVTSSANDEVRCDCTFSDDGNAS